MNQKNGTIKITIDDNVLNVKKGISILDAAEQNDIFIPSLCAYESLDPHGGCRVCIVEVEGKKGFLKSCATPVQEGMVVRTNTDTVQGERKKILQLLLSEHTSSCLICEEKEECRNSMSTIRKVGVTTGCRYCPGDNKCELQKVVEWVGVDELIYPTYYRNLPVEKEDPFYDRDYNLCILCGRCVRVCHEVRSANTLAFNQRGRDTVIGPAFGRNHIEAGCEFCGACVEVCPTGALSEKANKWDGIHETEEISTCALCGVGCQIKVLSKGDKLIGTLPAEDELVNDGHLCVKGRFCIYELVNNYQRLKKAIKLKEGSQLQIPIDEAVKIAAEKLADCKPDEFGMIISPNCTVEDLYIAQKFTRHVMSSHHIDTSARLFYGAGFNSYLKLMKKSTTLKNMKNSSLIFGIGADLRYGRSVVGVAIRNAIHRGAKIITIHPHDHSLVLSSDVWIQPTPGEEADILNSLSNILEDNEKKKVSADLSKIADLLKGAENPIFLIGTEFLNYSNSAEILELVNKIAEKINAEILTLPAQNNLYGSLLMGNYPELLPGGSHSSDKKTVADLGKLWGKEMPVYKNGWDLNKIVSGQKLKVAYLVGETPPIPEPISEYLIYQNIYPLDHVQTANLTFPAAAFTEVDGTFINGEGRIQPIKKSVSAPGDALPDWQILCKIAQKMGASGFDFNSIADIHTEIGKVVDAFKDKDRFARKAQPLPDSIQIKSHKTDKTGIKTSSKNKLFILTAIPLEHVYRGIPLTSKVEGLKKLFDESVVVLNNADAEKMNITNGEKLKISSDEFSGTFPVWISAGQKTGTVHITNLNFSPSTPNPQFVKLEREHV